jgi:transposase
LNRHTKDGGFNIDNNLAERVLRIVAIGRKNWLFAGSDANAERAAIIFSLIANCKLCEIDLFEYLCDVLDRISTNPASKIAESATSG